MPRQRIAALFGAAPFGHIWTDRFCEAIIERGDLTFEQHTGFWSDEQAADLLRDHDIAIVGWDTRGLPEALAEDPGRLSLVACYSGTIRPFVPRSIVASGLTVTNWGDLPAPYVAEAAMTHLLSALHQLPAAVHTTREGQWGIDITRNGSLLDLAVGIYGMGVIGRRFVELLAPFGARIAAFDPYVDELPDGVKRVDSLNDLCDWADALVIHAGLSDETEASLTAQHLARLGDGAIVVNTARGAIVDQDALFAEAISGRLRVGVDVLEPDQLAADHPVRQAPNFCYTFHQLDQVHWPGGGGTVPRIQQRLLDHIDRFLAGEEPQFDFDLDRFDRST